jgi:hypothetical protein
MQDYARQLAQQGPQRAGVASTAATQPPPPLPQHLPSSQLFQRPRAQATAFRSEIARHLSEIYRYYSCRSTGKEGKDPGNKNHFEVLRDVDEVQKRRKVTPL